MTFKRVLFAALLISLGLLGISGGAAAQSETPAAGSGQNFSPEATQAIQQPALSQTAASSSVSALGSVEPNTVAALQFQTSGTVKGVYAQVGDYVEAGEVLADLDDDDAWSSYSQAVLNLESANIAMTELMQPASDSDLKVAKANLASAQAAYTSTADSVTQAQIDAAQLKYDNAANQLAALQDARAHMNGTDEEITLQEAKIGAASFNAEIARLQLQELQTPNSSSLWSAGIRIEQAQLQLEQLQAPPAQSEIDSVQSTINRAQAAVLDAENALKRVQLVAPVSGYVTALNISAGESVGVGTVAIEISDLSSLHMTVPVNELDIEQISEGLNATITLDALTDLAIPGIVEHVGWLSATSSDGIVTYDVQVVLNTTDSRVRIGMTGEVTIETGSTGS
jgi:HlyD family secretion protein